MKKTINSVGQSCRFALTKSAGLILLAFLAVAVLSGCKSVTQKTNIVSITERTIGFKIGQNPQSQTPEVHLGFNSITFHVVPTSTNEIYAPAVTGGIDLQQKAFTTDIIEDFSTGQAATDNPIPKKKSATATTKNPTKPDTKP